MTDSHGRYHDEELDLTPPPVGAQYHPAETEDLLLSLRDMIENARPVPLSASSMISKEEALALLDDALHALPEELRAARWLLKEREEFLARTRREAHEILEQAQDRADRMVERTEVVKGAESRAYEIIETAEADARRLRHEVEDFCDQKLASFEIVLERTQKLVAAGRAKLQGANLLAEAAAAAEHGFEGTPAGDQSRDDVGFAAPPPPDRFAVDPLDPPLRVEDQPSLYDDEAVDDWDDEDEGWEDEPVAPAPGRPRLTVVDDRYGDRFGDRFEDHDDDRFEDRGDLPAPPASGHPTRSTPSGRGGGSNFFDQDLS